MNETTQRMIDEAIDIVAAYGLDVIGAIVILIVGWTVAGWSTGAVRKLLSKTGRVDETLRVFFASFARYVVLAITILAVLSQFGVQTASLITIFGAAGLAIGLALQGTLSNLAAGVMLLFFRPFRIGDYVEAGGVAGTVKAITLFVTELATPDNVQILVPNGQVWGSSVRNYSHHPTRRVDLALGIAYEDDIDAATRVILDTVSADARVHGDPEPMTAVSELADSSVNFVIRVWCDAGDYWDVKFDLTKALKQKLDAAGISIPYPQRTVHLVQPGEG
ncbi:MAG: mechanosensitive ion channel [Rhodospirillaceae bacterium]|jgi:small conductance mechanosensitive channel|nr:mechanosensitive ion channel [Rhodospirillaceae bacterium]MBT5667056.1 mechanosensitive ion channel [Rhodospirillaceae bacterium]MBT5810997.1 mechanosensitive ion channel [Rhodospirillaceae bacterium]